MNGIRRYTSSLYIIIAAALWGFIGLFSKNLTQAGCSSIQITFYRFFTGSISVLIYILFRDKSKLRIRLRDIWMFIGTGIVSIVFFNLLYLSTMRISTLSIAATLLYTSPIFVMVMSVFLFGERFTLRKLTALAVSVAGCICVVGIPDSIRSGIPLEIPALGILTGVGSGFCYALYSIFGNCALKRYSSETVTIYTFIIAFISLIPFIDTARVIPDFTSAAVLPEIIKIGILSTTLPYILYTAGLKNTEPGKASVMAFVEPVVATLISVFLFGEPISALGAGGIFMIFVSIIILNMREKS